MCRCKELKECEEALPTREQFIHGFTKLEFSSSNWTELFVCDGCGQHWSIEQGAEMDRRANRAFKISGRENWETYDISASLEEFLIAKSGGLSNDVCKFKGCQRKALKDKFVCVRHGFSEYAWGSNT